MLTPCDHGDLPAMHVLGGDRDVVTDSCHGFLAIDKQESMAADHKQFLRRPGSCL